MASMLSQLMGPMSILMPGFAAPLLRQPRQPLPPRRAVRAERQGAELRLVMTEPVPCGAVLLQETAMTSAETTTEERWAMGHGMPWAWTLNKKLHPFSFSFN